MCSYDGNMLWVLRQKLFIHFHREPKPKNASESGKGSPEGQSLRLRLKLGKRHRPVPRTAIHSRKRSKGRFILLWLMLFTGAINFR